MVSLVGPHNRNQGSSSNALISPISDGLDAASLTVAEQYVKAFSALAKQNNTLILSNNVNDVSSMVTQAMSIYKTVSNTNRSSSEKPKFIDDKGEYYSD